MAPASTFTPKASLTDAPTNLKEAIDWVLRVTGRDGKKLGDDECICGLAAAVTDLLQSVQLEYHGYQGDTKETGTNNGASDKDVEQRLNELFSLVQGLGGTAVVRTYIDQLAQVLSALVGWSRIVKCTNGDDRNGCKGTDECKGNNGGNGGTGCEYLKDVTANTPCTKCKCMKWEVPKPGKDDKGHHLGRGCQCDGGTRYIESYKSSYSKNNDLKINSNTTTWEKLGTSSDRYKCARILLGSVCLIWSGVTYMHWTGKWTKTSPYWNNHILDGSGLDDGTLSQWLQALGFPRKMLNNSGPGNRLDAIIWNGLSDKLLLGFAKPSGLSGDHVSDTNGNTARNPFGMNYAGFVHTIHRDSFNSDATVFPKNGYGSSSSGQDTETNQHKRGALFKLYILSCAYFTGLQQKAAESTSSTQSIPQNPKTIREILYWLSALPYSPAYPKILTYGKDRLEKVLKKPEENSNETPTLAFHQEGRNAPITVHEFNLFAHFQAVTQYCPLVLIGIQGGIHSTKGTDETLGPPIHSLYANTECQFTYPSVQIQAYNQVVHYIRALFYQLYFLRKQCAVKVTCGGKWRECRYGNGVESKGVISWMCLGCDPMEHDRKKRVKEMGKVLDGIMKGVETVSLGKESKTLPGALKDVLEKIGDVVVQLGNAQEVLENNINNVTVAVEALKKVEGVNSGSNLQTVLVAVLGEVETKVKALTTEVEKKADGETSQALKKAKDALLGAKNTVEKDGDKKNEINAAHHGLQMVLEIFNKWLKNTSKRLDDHKEVLLKATEQIISICNTAKCKACSKHSDKCGQKGEKKMCDKCHQQYMDGTPSPLQAFLEDRLPGFSCKVVRNDDNDKPNYPPAASHLGHCGGSGQCCPLPMGFRNQFHKGSTSDSTGARLYGILYFFSNENMMQSCVYTLVRVTAELSATTPQVLGDVFGFFRGGVGNPEKKVGEAGKNCDHEKDPKTSTGQDNYFCGWCASGLRDEVQKIEWIPNGNGTPGGQYRGSVGEALIDIKGEKGTGIAQFSSNAGATTNTSLSALTKDSEYLSPLTGELYTAVSATFGGTYLSWVLYLSDALEGGLKSLASAFQQIECNACKGQCDPNKCKKGHHGATGGGQCLCQSIVSCTGVLPVLYRHGFSYGNPFNLEGYHQKDGKTDGQYDIEDKKKDSTKRCHEFLESLNKVLEDKQATSQDHPLTELLTQVGQLQYDIRLPWIFVLTLAWLVAVLYLAFGAIWPLDWTHMRSHWLRGGEHQWQCMWYKVMTGRKGMELVEYFECN